MQTNLQYNDHLKCSPTKLLSTLYLCVCGWHAGDAICNNTISVHQALTLTRDYSIIVQLERDRAVEKARLASNWVNSNIGVFAHTVTVPVIVSWSRQQLQDWAQQTVQEGHSYDVDWAQRAVDDPLSYDDVRDKTLFTLHSAADTRLFIVLVNDALGIPANVCLDDGGDD